MKVTKFIKPQIQPKTKLDLLLSSPGHFQILSNASYLFYLSTPNWPKKTGPSGEAKYDVFFRLTVSLDDGPISESLSYV
jgi:hypothetical protein